MKREPLLPQRFVLVDKWGRADDVGALVATGGMAATSNGWSRLSPASNVGPRGEGSSTTPSAALVGTSGLLTKASRRSPPPATSDQQSPATNKKRRKRRALQPDHVDDDEDLVPEAAVTMEAFVGDVPERGRFNFELQRHCVRERQGTKSFRCDVCGGTYRHAFSLKRHYLRTHVNYVYLSGSDISNCNINLSVREKAAREEFRRRLSRGPGSGTVVMTGLYRCNTCSALFDDLSPLKFHVKNHPDSLNSKFFPCSQCRMTFSHKQNLVRHLSVHSGEKPYSCKYCHKGFPTATNQRRHERIHEGIKPYSCPHCVSFFSQSGDLKKHIRKLHCDFFFPCAFCLKYYSDEMRLREHVLSHGKTLELNCKALKKKATSGSLKTQKQQPPILAVAPPTTVPAAPPPQQPSVLLASAATCPRKRFGKQYSVRCSSCTKRFANRNNLRRHQRLAHPLPARPRRNVEGGARRSRPPPQVDAEQYRGSSAKTRGQQPLMPSKFFANVSHNIAQNLQHYIDGKLTTTAHHHRYTTTAPPSSAKPLPVAERNNISHNQHFSNQCQNSNVALDLTRYNFPAGYDGATEETALLSPGRKDASAVYDDVAEEDQDGGLAVGCSSAWPRASWAATAAAACDANVDDDGYTDEDEDSSCETGALDLSPVRDPAHAEAHSSTDKANSIILYLCYACGEKFFSVADIEEHKVNNHPNVYCTHLEIEGTTKNMPLELLRYQCTPVGLLHMAHVPPVAVSTPSAQLRCTKCQQSFQKTAELHEHILVCGVEQPPAGATDSSALDGGDTPAATSERSSFFPSLPRNGKKSVNRGMKRLGVDNEAVVGVAARRMTPPIGRKTCKKSRKDRQSSTSPSPASTTASSSERSNTAAEAKTSRTPTPVDVSLLFEQQQQVLDEIALTCDGCNRKFKYASALERHRRYCQEEETAALAPGLVHDGPKKSHTCQHCSRSFAYVATLKRHMAEFCGSSPSAASPLVLEAVAATTTTPPTKKSKLVIAVQPSRAKKMTRRRLRRRRKVAKTSVAAAAAEEANNVKENSVESVVVEMILAVPTELPSTSPKADRHESRPQAEVVEEHNDDDAPMSSTSLEMQSPDSLDLPAKVVRERVDEQSKLGSATSPSSSSSMSDPVKEPQLIVEAISSKKTSPKKVVTLPSSPGAGVVKSKVTATLSQQIKQEFRDKAAVASDGDRDVLLTTPSTSELSPAVSPAPSSSTPKLPKLQTLSAPSTQLSKSSVSRLASPTSVTAFSTASNPSSPKTMVSSPTASSPPSVPRSPLLLLSSSISVLPDPVATHVPLLPASMPSLPSSISVIPLSDSGFLQSDRISSPTFSSVSTFSATPVSPEPVLTQLSSSRASPIPRVQALSSPIPLTSGSSFAVDSIESCVEGPDGLIIKVESMDETLHREQQHTCPNCKRTFTYLANFKKHLNDLCPLRLIRHDESDPLMPLVAPEVVTDERGAEESDAGSSGCTPERPVKAASVFPCTICHKEFSAYVVMLKHRLSHKLRPSGSPPTLEGASISSTKLGGGSATLDWKCPYSWFGNKLQQSLNRGTALQSPKVSEKPLQLANTGSGLQLLPGKPGRPIGSTRSGGFTPVCHDDVSGPPDSGIHRTAAAVVEKLEPEEPALGQSEWLDINAVLNMPDCYYDDDDVFAEPAMFSSQSTTLSETSSTITRALSSVYRSGALIHKVEESKPPSPASVSLIHRHHTLHDDERHLLEGGDELANLDD